MGTGFHQELHGERRERIDFDAVSAEYAKHRKVHPEVLRHLVAAAATGSEPVLEVGCGTGNYIAAIQSITGLPCHGVDPSEKMLTVARQQNAFVDFQTGRGERLPCADRMFGLAFSVDVIHHIVSRADCFPETRRVLRDAGTICTVTESETMIRRRLHSHYFPDTISVELERYPPIPDLTALMEQAGFTNIREEVVEFRFQVADIQPYRDKAFSSLHYLSDEAFRRGIEEMEQDLRQGPLQAVRYSILLWGTKI